MTGQERIPILLTREDAEAVLVAISVAQDEMPFSEYDERWAAIAAKLRALDAGEGE